MEGRSAPPTIPEERQRRTLFPMTDPDLNLLKTLEALLVEDSVAGAARRVGLSPSAMSRALQRLRDTTGDPLLVRSGRRMVPTPRAQELRERIGPLLQTCGEMLRPQQDIDLSRVQRDFTLRVSDAFVANSAAELVRRTEADAPGIRLRFAMKQDRQDHGLRDGRVDLEIAVVHDGTDPELRSRAVLRDSFVGVMRKAHPLAKETMTLERYTACRHVDVARHTALTNKPDTPADRALAAIGYSRYVAVVADNFSSALAIARTTDLIATVPARGTRAMRGDLTSFSLPFDSPKTTLSMIWHPRLEADPAHRWLRSVVQDICAQEA